MNDEQEGSPISMLASEYRDDLTAVKMFKKMGIITDRDVAKLNSFVIKYGLVFKHKLCKNNFYDITGKLESIILKKMEDFAIGDILEKVREETPDKQRKTRKLERQEVPKSIQ